ncbi:MAG: hypothetical protein QOE35_2922 [Actinomycetota bacterium]
MDVRSNVRAGKVLAFFGVLMLVVGFMQTGAGAGGWKTASSGAPGQAKKHEAVTTTTVAVDAASSANTDCGSYCSTSDGTPSMNGNGGGNGNQPCAGCVGNADDKNPPGQYKDGSDHNNGYECDGNNGVGKTNPAHSGCTTTTTPHQTTTTAPHQTTTTAAQSTTTTAPQSTTTTIASTTTTAAVGGTTTTADVLGVQFTRGTETSRGLASTGAGFFRPFMLLGALMLLIGVTLMTIKVSPQARA